MPATEDADLTICTAEAVRDHLLSSTPFAAPPAEVDTAGLQLLVSALKSGVAVEEAVLDAPQVKALCDLIGLTLPTTP